MKGGGSIIFSMKGKFSGGGFWAKIGKKKFQAAHQHVDRKRSSGDGVNRNVSEKVGELLRVHRGGGDDQLQVAPAADDRPQDSEQDVGVERPLVSFVHDDGTETKQNGDLGCYGGRVGADC